ncbi:MAG: hypothetical protein Fur0025_18800 [Oscillatoriaceae cyanobacterium]
MARFPEDGETRTLRLTLRRGDGGTGTLRLTLRRGDGVPYARSAGYANDWLRRVTG